MKCTRTASVVVGLWLSALFLPHTASAWINAAMSGRRNSGTVAKQIVPTATQLYMAENSEEDENEQTLFRLLNYRRKSKKEDSPMVKPIDWKDGSTIEDNDVKQTPSRVRTKLESFFAGMPKVGEILGDVPPTENADDDAWFDAYRQEIEVQYEQMEQDMLQELAEQRRQDPESVPDNAENMIRSVIAQEKERDIKDAKDEIAQQQLRQYERELRDMTEGQEELGETPESVKQLIDESEEEYQRMEASRADVDAFLAYEQEAFRAAAEQSSIESMPEQGENLDRWALERLQDMADDARDKDGSEVILDILEENLGDLQQRMEKESNRGSLEPDTLKEWQMYRSIATRLGTSAEGEEKIRDERILQQLDSWKSYITKEEVLRREAGLSRGPKLPFEWQEADYEEARVKKDKVAAPVVSKAEARKEINRKSIEALESLLATSDPMRQERLQAEIDYLRSTLEANDWLDVEVDEDNEDQTSAGPIDAADLFNRFNEDDFASSEAPPVVGRTVPAEQRRREEVAAGPPETPFFASDDSSRMTDRDISPPPPPKTAFFSNEIEEEVDMSVAPTDSKLGTSDDQKLAAMFRRAGAWTKEDQDRIRSQYEAFQQYESMKRDSSGLSGSDQAGDSFDNKYNVSEVVNEDGDFDYEKVLSSIGPRPTRAKKLSGGDTTTDLSSSSSSVGDKEVFESMYRSVSAVGGGRYKDNPFEDARQRQAYQELKEAEESMRQASLNEETTSDNVAAGDVSPDDAEYAANVIQSLGPRPARKRRRIDEAFLSDNFNLDRSLDEEDDDDDSFESSMAAASRDTVERDPNPPFVPSSDLEMPEWLRRENAEKTSSTRRKSFLDTSIEEGFDDTDYEKNMRQLADYKRRRAGKSRSMGIDISDVVGSHAFNSDDYADYKYESSTNTNKGSPWGSVNFEARKRDLLDYQELDVVDVNNLMDHKESVYTTGVSQYTPRINKPFKEFGAVFKLESVLVDALGLQTAAWQQVVERQGLRMPDVEELRRAAAVEPSIAVRDLFGWTNDYFEGMTLAGDYYASLSKCFDEWAATVGLDADDAAVEEPADTRGSLAIGEEIIEEPTFQLEPITEQDFIESVKVAWDETARTYGKNPPSDTQLFLAATVTPDVAASKVFGWASDSLEIDRISDTYRGFAGGSSSSSRRHATSTAPPVASSPLSRGVISREELMEYHYQAWSIVAEYFEFERPEPDEAVAAFVINDPAIAIRDGFGWTSDAETIREAEHIFHRSLKGLIEGEPVVDEPPEDRAFDLDLASSADESALNDSVKFANAWRDVASELSIEPPDYKQLLEARSVGPVEAILTVFHWTSDPFRAEEIFQLFRKQYGGDEGTVPAPPSVQPKKDPEVLRCIAEAWAEIASMGEVDPPTSDQLDRSQLVGPIEAILSVFQYTDDPVEADEIHSVYVTVLEEKLASLGSRNTVQQENTPLVKTKPGCDVWIRSLLDVGIPCGVVTTFNRRQAKVLLDFSGLSDMIGIDKCVTSDLNLKLGSQQVLHGALRVERRPDHCVVFDSSPYTALDAHDVQMQSVSVIGCYPRYELLSSDLTASSFDELSAMNIRRLFGERVFDEPMVESVQNQPDNKKRTKTMYDWDDD